MFAEGVVVLVSLIIPLLVVSGAVSYSQIERRCRSRLLVPLGLIGTVLLVLQVSDAVSTLGWLVITLTFQLLVVSSASRAFRSTSGEELRSEPVVGGDPSHSAPNFLASAVAVVVPLFAYHWVFEK